MSNGGNCPRVVNIPEQLLSQRQIAILAIFNQFGPNLGPKSVDLESKIENKSWSMGLLGNSSNEVWKL